MDKHLNVLMIDPWVGNDYSLFLCSNLKEEGVNVTLIINEDRNININGFNLLRILPSKEKSYSKSGKLKKYISYLSSLYSLATQKKYNFVHFQAFRRRRIESLFFYILKLKKVRLVYTVHDVDPLDWSRIDRLLNKLIYKSADSLIVHSETNKNLLMKKYNVGRNKISIMPHGSFENSYPSKALTGAQARKLLDLKKEDNILLCFGAVKEYKGIDLLIEAAARASEKVKNLILIIAGRAEHESLGNQYLRQIENLNAPLKVVPHFKFIGEQDVEMYFKAADLVVLPYRIISHSGVLHLAYSFSKPVIASRAGDFEECVYEGETGFLFDKDNEDDLTSVIIKAFDSKEKLHNMGEYARKINNEQFSWLKSAQKLKYVYQNLKI